MLGHRSLIYFHCNVEICTLISLLLNQELLRKKLVQRLLQLVFIVVKTLCLNSLYSVLRNLFNLTTLTIDFILEDRSEHTLFDQLEVDQLGSHVRWKISISHIVQYCKIKTLLNRTIIYLNKFISRPGQNYETSTKPVSKSKK